MATTAPKPAAKAGPQPVPDAPPVEEVASSPKKSKTKLFIIIGAVALLLAGSGIGVWFGMSHGQKRAKPAAAKTAEAGATAEAPTPAATENADATDTAAADSEDGGKQEPPKPPVFLNIDQFTVNLQPEGANDQFLQISITLQVADENQVELIKEYMPQIRSRLLMLLSSKKASEISSTDGKKKLADEIMAQVKQPFNAQSSPQSVSNVFFTSFVIQ